jgi:hypothetical protein
MSGFPDKTFYITSANWNWLKTRIIGARNAKLQLMVGESCTNSARIEKTITYGDRN